MDYSNSSSDWANPDSHHADDYHTTWPDQFRTVMSPGYAQGYTSGPAHNQHGPNVNVFGEDLEPVTKGDHQLCTHPCGSQSCLYHYHHTVYSSHPDYGSTSILQQQQQQQQQQAPDNSTYLSVATSSDQRRTRSTSLSLEGYPQAEVPVNERLVSGLGPKTIRASEKHYRQKAKLKVASMDLKVQGRPGQSGWQGSSRHGQ